jgi:hypothetical protein
MDFTDLERRSEQKMRDMEFLRSPVQAKTNCTLDFTIASPWQKQLGDV